MGFTIYFLIKGDKQDRIDRNTKQEESQKGHKK